MQAIVKSQSNRFTSLLDLDRWLIVCVIDYIEVDDMRNMLAAYERSVDDTKELKIIFSQLPPKRALWKDEEWSKRHGFEIEPCLLWAFPDLYVIHHLFKSIKEDEIDTKFKRTGIYTTWIHENDDLWKNRRVYVHSVNFTNCWNLGRIQDFRWY